MLVAVGLVLLAVGGEVVVRGASRLAIALGVKPVVVGATVLAAATSAPELASSLTAVYAGSPAIAVGNVLGSNIANIGLILGLSGLLAPLSVHSVLLARELPVMVGASLLLVVLGADGDLSRVDGWLLLAGLVAYLWTVVRVERRGADPVLETEVRVAVGGAREPLKQLAVVVGGVVVLVVGADQLVDGAVGLARAWAVPEAVIGLTVVAVGTSLPELAASLAAARRGHADLVLGNVIGSNLFNVLGILGLTAAARPLVGAMAGMERDQWVALGFALFLVPALGRARRLSRQEAGLLLGAYAVYVGTLV